MATLGTQNISTSYPQLLKTLGLGGVDGTLQAITDGDNTSSALELSTLGVNSTGTLNVAGATTLASSLAVTAACTFSSSLGVTGAATFSSSLGVTGAATFSSSLGVTGAATFSSSLGITGAATFSSSISATTGTHTLGTISSNYATVGTLEIGATGPNITKASFGTAAFTSATVSAHNALDATTGTFALTGSALGDIVFGSLNSLGSATGTVNIGLSFYPTATDVVRYSIQNQGATAGTIPAGTFFATAMRFTT